jgi:hypothetical protein
MTSSVAPWIAASAGRIARWNGSPPPSGAVRAHGHHPPERFLDHALGGMSGNYLASQLKILTDSFVWIYAAIAIAAALLGLLTVLLPRDRKHQSEGKARLQAASAQSR